MDNTYMYTKFQTSNDKTYISVYSFLLDLLRNTQIELLQPSAVLGGQGDPDSCWPIWSHFMTIRLGRAALKKKASFPQVLTCRETPKLNFCNQVQSWGGLGNPDSCWPFWSNFMTIGLGRAALKKNASFPQVRTCREMPKFNFYNQVQSWGA